MMRCVLLLAVISVWPGTIASGAAPPWRLINIESDVYLEPDARRMRVHGTAVLQLVVARDSAPTLRIGGGTTELFRFTSARLDGATAELNLKAGGEPGANLVRFHVPRDFRRGDKVTIHFEFNSVSKSAFFAIAGNGAFAGHSSGWYPQPVAAPGELLSTKADKSDGYTRIHMPVSWSSVSNGERVERQEHGNHAIESWKVRGTARSFAAAAYTRFETRVSNRPLSIYRLAGVEGHAVRTSDRELTNNLASGFEVLQGLFGPFPYPSYSVAELPDDLVPFWGIQLKDFTAVRTSLLQTPKSGLQNLAHELAHGWWGNLILSADPGADLVTEGLAQFSALYVLRALFGDGYYYDVLRSYAGMYPPSQSAKGYFDILRSGADVPLSQINSANPTHYDLANGKGAWVFSMLLDKIGPETFFKVLRQAAEAGSLYTVTDMRRDFVNAAPDAGLDVFFAQWLDRTGAPAIQSDWTTGRDQGGPFVDVALTQIQPGPAYHLDLEIKVMAGSDEFRLESVTMTDKSTRVRIRTISTMPTDVQLDPYGRLLLWRDEFGTSPY